MPVLRKVPYDTTACDGDPDRPSVTWQQYYGLRNRVLQALRSFGSVGPMGECRITGDPEGPPEPWPVEAETPDFFVVDDWYNDWSKWLRVEVDAARVDEAVLLALADTLAAMPPDWAIGVAVEDGYVLLFADRIMTDGPRFAGTPSFADVVQACRRPRQ